MDIRINLLFIYTAWTYRFL